MEAKFFSEIEKKMDVKTLKDFEREVGTKITHEFEGLRKTNDDLSRVLIAELHACAKRARGWSPMAKLIYPSQKIW